MRLTIVLRTFVLLSLVIATACTSIANQQKAASPISQPMEANDNLDSTSTAEVYSDTDSKSSTPEQTTSNGVVSPNSSVTPGPSLTPDPGTPVPVIIEPGEVTITLSEPMYTKGQLIEATIFNGLVQTIYTEDSKSDCSIAILENWGGSNWQPLPGCNLRRTPLIVAIDPGQERVIMINPFSDHFGVDPLSTDPAFSAGTYRIKLPYRMNTGPEGETPYEANSMAFDIHP